MYCYSLGRVASYLLVPCSQSLSESGSRSC